MESHRLLDQLEQRGMIEQVTNRAALDELLAKPGQSIYVGFDPTADSLHVGHFLPVLMLARFQGAGHRPIVLVGGATGMVGDPSGKSTERNLMDDDTLAVNLAGIRSQLSRLVDFDDAKTGAIMTNNADWTRGVGLLEFLRDYGKHLTVNYMLAKRSEEHTSELQS